MRLARTARNAYLCATCKKTFGRSEIAVDHISPIVPVTGWDGWDGFIERLFCDSDKLQVLCVPCHAVKTKAENAERRLHAKSKSPGV